MHQNYIFTFLLQRWSTTLSLICYISFFVIIWCLALPLKSEENVDSNSGDNLAPNEIENFKFKPNLNPGFITNKFQINETPRDIQIDYEKNREPTVILKEIFKRADTNANNLLDANELAKWIHFKIKQHIAKAVRNNYGLFAKVDVNPKNGVVTWEEYHAYFLKQKGLSSHYVKNHDEKKHVGLQRSLKEQIMRDKAYWREAARFDPNSLTVDEFLTFTHPESSATNQLALVDELFEKLDRDSDDSLTEDEFATSVINDDTSILLHQSETKRRKEFQNSIDLNRDGRADRRELLRYVAPQNPRRSELEAQTLISLADTDHDDALSLSEVLARPELFMASKMVDTSQSFHDEF